jgi:bile acid-coenzyme A ligase
VVDSVPPISTQVSALAATAPDEPAVTCEDRTITRGELDSSTNRLARAYAARGVGVGDYVSIAMPNSIEFIQASLACWKIGAVPQPLSARLPDAEFAGILDLKPRALIVGRADPRGEVQSVPMDFAPGPQSSDAPLPEAVSPVWKSMTSGGSTGRPKLIEAGGDSRLPAAAGSALGAQEGDVNLLSVPLTHTTGFTTATLALLMGHHLVVMPRFDAHEFLGLVTEHGVTYLATVPTVMQRLLPVYQATPDAYDLSSIRRFWHLGAPCPPAVKRAWIDLLGPEKVWELYGGTELQSITVISGDMWLTHPGSVSPPTYRYVGVTAKSGDGWDSLGDLGWYEDDGSQRFFYLSDRRVDMFTVGGRNVYPAEIESALAEHPNILSSLVVGVPDEDLGQVPHALVQAAVDMDEASVRTFLAERLAGYKVPRTVEFTDQPLRDDAGKARRSAVRDGVISRRAAQLG